MRVTVCELPHDPGTLAGAWDELCRHSAGHRSELVLLPEFAWIPPLWEEEHPDPARWAAAEALSDRWLERLPELGARYVAGSRPVTQDGKRYNQGYLWSPAGGLMPLRRKFFFPDEPGAWEARWFEAGDPEFPAFQAGPLTFGMNICTELWALETHATYAGLPVQMILTPRATGAATTANWLSAGVVAAVRSGAFSVSSNRVDPSGACGGVGWIIDPDGRILAQTSAVAPCRTGDVDLARSDAARHSYPRSVFAKQDRSRPESGCLGDRVITHVVA